MDWIYDILSRAGTTDLYEYITGREAPCAGADCAQMVTEAGGLTDWLQGLLGGIFTQLITALPQGGNFPPEFHTAAIYFGNSLQSVAFMLPVDALVYCLVFSFGTLFILFSFHVMRSVLNFVRGINTERYGVADTY